MHTFKQFIAGEWVGAAKSWEVINPATEDRVETIPFGDARDCRSAIEAAVKAFPSWSRKTSYERSALLKRTADLMRQRSEEYARFTVLESGKPFIQAKLEWDAAGDMFEWFAEEGKRAYGRTVPSRKPDKRMTVLLQPIGVVGVITAWNFPVWNPARSCAAALAAGCTVVCRPSEFTPLTGMLLAQCLQDAGIPAGVFNLISGDPDSMGQEMLDNPHLRKISFTGSPRVGKILMDGASRTMTRLSLELGGNAPVLIFPDVDLKALAQSAVTTKFRNAGQVCVSPQRFLVSKEAESQFIDEVSKLTGELKVGSGLEKETQVGPLINAKQRNHIAELVDDARKGGCSIPVGGKVPNACPKGYFYEPTVLASVTPEQRIFSDEAFGPVMPVTSFHEVEEAVHLANQTPYGLAAYVWTNNLRVANLAAERLEFGIVGVNEWVAHAIEAPFTGWKQSGVGSECGKEGLDEYLEKKLVSMGGY